MKAFSLANAPHLPVTGDSHPLVKESLRRLTTANAITLVGALLLFGGIYVLASRGGNATAPTIELPRGPETASTPTIVPPSGTLAGFTVADHKFGVPDPKPNVIESEDRFSAEPGNNEEELPPGFGPGEFPDEPFAFGPAAIQRPDTIVVFDELPVLLSIGEPVYPDLARRAGIDGTVLVKVFITRAGKVKQAVAVEGPDVLRNSAVDAAKTALFVPAKQGDTPVDVWVMIPVTFSLNR